MALTKVDISMLEDAGATGQVLTSDGTNWTSAAAAAGGDMRNFITDGDFTQWPEGTAATTVVNGKYGPALLKNAISGAGVYTWERSTDVPTFAASGHESEYSVLYKCTTADASVAAGDRYDIQYALTGSDFSPLYGQEITVSFWAKTAANNSGDTYYLTLGNGGGDYNYPMDFTPTSTWTKFTHTVTMTTSGTWTMTEAGAGLWVYFAMVAGTDLHAASVDTWNSGAGFDTAISGNSNFAASTSNEFYISQFSIVKGSSTPSGFLGEPVSTVKDQVEYYVETKGTGDNYQSFAAGVVYTAGDAYCHGPTYRRKRKLPTIALKGSNPLIRIFAGTNIQACTINSFQSPGLSQTRSRITPATSNLTTGWGCWYGGSGGNAYILIDARH